MASAKKKPTTLSGIQPTGQLHIGNYLGALKNFVLLQKKYDSYFMVADLHSLTENYQPSMKNTETMMAVASFLAAGLSPQKSTIFLQSSVPEHTELAWIFNTITPIGELERMTQYKDKAARQAKNINAGLLTYPVLQAADILLYKSSAVPIGDDQVQHLELTRTIARRFNNKFGDTFPLPKALHTAVPRLMSLTDPTRKMSKSEPSGCLFLTDPPDVIKHKIEHAVTDTGPQVRGEMSPGVKNLFLLLNEFSNPETVKRFQASYTNGSIRYSELKATLAKNIAKQLAPFEKKFNKLMKRKNYAYLHGILKNGSKRAQKVAAATLKEVKQKIGLPV